MDPPNKRGDARVQTLHGCRPCMNGTTWELCIFLVLGEKPIGNILQKYLLLQMFRLFIESLELIVSFKIAVVFLLRSDEE